MCHWRLPDRNDAATFAIAGALCHGRVELQGIRGTLLAPLLEALRTAGVAVVESGEKVAIHGERWAGGRPLHIESGPYPAFASDWGPMIQVFMTQLSGISSFHETVHSRRLSHLTELARMGTTIAVGDADSPGTYLFSDPSPDGQLVHIGGRTRLHSAEVRGDNVRGAAALLLAGLIANGETTLSGTSYLDHGYDRLIPRLRKLGASIRLNPEMR